MRAVDFLRPRFVVPAVCVVAAGVLMYHESMWAIMPGFFIAGWLFNAIK